MVAELIMGRSEAVANSPFVSEAERRAFAPCA